MVRDPNTQQQRRRAGPEAYQSSGGYGYMSSVREVPSAAHGCLAVVAAVRLPAALVLCPSASGSSLWGNTIDGGLPSLHGVHRHNICDVARLMVPALTPAPIGKGYLQAAIALQRNHGCWLAIAPAAAAAAAAAVSPAMLDGVLTVWQCRGQSYL
jgi:hypothetical protein